MRKKIVYLEKGLKRDKINDPYISSWINVFLVFMNTKDVNKM